MGDPLPSLLPGPPLPFPLKLAIVGAGLVVVLTLVTKFVQKKFKKHQPQ